MTIVTGVVLDAEAGQTEGSTLSTDNIIT